MTKSFASAEDKKVQRIEIIELDKNVYGYVAGGDPNTGFIIGKQSILVIDALSTPKAAKKMLAEIRKISHLPVRYLFLTHYHAVRTLGASAFQAHEIITSEATRDLIIERGQQDFESELRRFPRLFDEANTIPGLTFPTQTFSTKMTIWFEDREIQFLHLGRGHTKGDAVCWLPNEKILFSGDLVEKQAALYTGDAYLRDWQNTLDELKKLGAEKIVPGRGSAATSLKESNDAIEFTKRFADTLFKTTEVCVKEKKNLQETFQIVYAVMQEYKNLPIFEHCIPFDVARAYDEASGKEPEIWTQEKDQHVWDELQNNL